MKDVKIILDWELDDMRSVINMIINKICSIKAFQRDGLLKWGG